jgi:hypothetical protein
MVLLLYLVQILRWNVPLGISDKLFALGDYSFLYVVADVSGCGQDMSMSQLGFSIA